MENQRQTDLTIGDVDCLLKNFSRFWNLPAPNLPERDEALWRQAIDKAWQGQQRRAETVATAMAVGGGSSADVNADLKRRKALRTAEEEQTGRPSTMGLSDRFGKEAERVYRQLDRAYAKAERVARRRAAAEAAPILAELDLHLVSVKAGLLQWSELSTNIGAAGAWKTYQDVLRLLGEELTASRRGSGEGSASRKRPPVGKVIWDLRRIKAKLARANRAENQAEGKGALASGEDEQYVFRREGEMWRLVFDGQETFMKDAKGLRYIAYLMLTPHRLIGINELFLAVNPPPGRDYRAQLISQASPEELTEAGLSISDLGTNETVIDPDTRRAYEHRLEVLEKDYAVEQEHDPAKAAEIMEEIDKIQEALQFAKGLRNRIRPISSIPERKRKAITNCIGDAFDRIDKDHESLGRHLRNSVRTGYSCCYAPEYSIPWAL